MKDGITDTIESFDAATERQLENMRRVWPDTMVSGVLERVTAVLKSGILVSSTEQSRLEIEWRRWMGSMFYSCAAGSYGDAITAVLNVIYQRQDGSNCVIWISALAPYECVSAVYRFCKLHRHAIRFFDVDSTGNLIFDAKQVNNVDTSCVFLHHVYGNRVDVNLIRAKLNSWVPIIEDVSWSQWDVDRWSHKSSRFVISNFNSDSQIPGGRGALIGGGHGTDGKDIRHELSVGEALKGHRGEMVTCGMHSKPDSMSCAIARAFLKAMTVGELQSNARDAARAFLIRLAQCCDSTSTLADEWYEAGSYHMVLQVKEYGARGPDEISKHRDTLAQAIRDRGVPVSIPHRHPCSRLRCFGWSTKHPGARLFCSKLIVIGGGQYPLFAQTKTIARRWGKAVADSIEELSRGLSDET